MRYFFIIIILLVLAYFFYSFKNKESIKPIDFWHKIESETKGKIYYTRINVNTHITTFFNLTYLQNEKLVRIVAEDENEAIVLLHHWLNLVYGHFTEDNDFYRLILLTLSKANRYPSVAFKMKEELKSYILNRKVDSNQLYSFDLAK